MLNMKIHLTVCLMLKPMYSLFIFRLIVYLLQQAWNLRSDVLNFADRSKIVGSCLARHSSMGLCSTIFYSMQYTLYLDIHLLVPDSNMYT